MNICMFNGNLTKDIELRSTQSGKSVGSFSLAIDEAKDKVTFVDFVVWDKTAELMQQYTRKGDKICVSGKLQKRSYDKDGHKVWVTEIIVDKFDFPAKRGEALTGEQSGVSGNVGGSGYEDIADTIPF